MAAGSRVALVARLQGVFYVLTGLWPVLSRATFEAVAGPKTDYWLVQAFGSVLAMIGVVLLFAARTGRIGREVVVLGVGMATVVAGCDVLAAAQPRNSGAYLADAAVEAGFVVWWVWAWRGGR